MGTFCIIYIGEIDFHVLPLITLLVCKLKAEIGMELPPEEFGIHFPNQSHQIVLIILLIDYCNPFGAETN